MGDGGFDTILERLPSDPFGMDVGCSFIAAFDEFCKGNSMGRPSNYGRCTGPEWELYPEFNYCWDDSGWLPSGKDFGNNMCLSQPRRFTSRATSEDWAASFQLKDQWGLDVDRVSHGDELFLGHKRTKPHQAADLLDCYANFQLENQWDLDVDCVVEGDKLLFVYTRKKQSRASDLLARDANNQLELQVDLDVNCSLKRDELLSLNWRPRQDPPSQLMPSEEVEHVQGNLSDEKGQLHDGLIFALSYLSVRDLLSVEMVCKRLRDEVRSDPLLWSCIHINQPLSEKLTDVSLLQLTVKAKGMLNCLNLVNCLEITDVGLKHVLQSNPRISKLSVPGCMRLTLNGLMSSLRMIQSPTAPGIKYLRIGGMYGVTHAVYEEIKLLLGLNEHLKLNIRIPRYYHTGFSSFSCDYDSAVDIELCPRCNNWRLVYDCPLEICPGKRFEPCRGCVVCIARCSCCGRCINDNDYEETFFLDLLCFNCFKNMTPCQEEQVDGANFDKLLLTSETPCAIPK